jgi:hypothetical protein
METLPVYVFKDSFGPFLALLNEHHVKYQMRDARSGVQMAAAGVIEILQTPAMWAGLAAVIVAFLKYRHSRKVTVTMKNKTLIHAEGLTAKELERVLDQAQSLTAIETEKKDKT